MTGFTVPVLWPVWHSSSRNWQVLLYLYFNQFDISGCNDRFYCTCALTSLTFLAINDRFYCDLCCNQFGTSGHNLQVLLYLCYIQFDTLLAVNDRFYCTCAMTSLTLFILLLLLLMISPDMKMFSPGTYPFRSTFMLAPTGPEAQHRQQIVLSPTNSPGLYNVQCSNCDSRSALGVLSSAGTESLTLCCFTGCFLYTLYMLLFYSFTRF